jgi:virginiamycin A acetyltransferase
MIKRVLTRILNWLLKDNPEYQNVLQHIGKLGGATRNSQISEKASLTVPYAVVDSTIGAYSYLGEGAKISMVSIGKFCSIGPNLLAGRGIHPLNGISTSPMFYSAQKQNGATFSATDKIEERKPIVIGNDVFIGANVTILDGVTIGDGAVIGAGAVVAKDVQPYGIALGVPAQVTRYRFDEQTIEKFLKLKWWDWPEEKLKKVEARFFDIETFLKEHTD